MHEMSIAEALLHEVLRVARQNGARAVEQVDVRIGAMKLIVPDALQLAWEAIIPGTPAAGAHLTTTEVPMKARCRPCGRHFRPAINDYLCPGCQRADVDIIEGDDIILASITCQAEEGAATS